MGHPVLEFVIGLLFILFVAWLMQGGYKDTERTSNKFIEPASPLGGGEVYDKKFFEANFFAKPRLDNETE